jgi:hypothetical protein
MWLAAAAGGCFMHLRDNNVHPVGRGPSRLVDAVAGQIEALLFTPLRFTDEAVIAPAEKLPSTGRAAPASSWGAER